MSQVHFLMQKGSSNTIKGHVLYKGKMTAEKKSPTALRLVTGKLTSSSWHRLIGGEEFLSQGPNQMQGK
jgi:hypothetical protein